MVELIRSKEPSVDDSRYNDLVDEAQRLANQALDRIEARRDELESELAKLAEDEKQVRTEIEGIPEDPSAEGSADKAQAAIDRLTELLNDSSEPAEHTPPQAPAKAGRVMPPPAPPKQRRGWMDSLRGFAQLTSTKQTGSTQRGERP